MTSAPDARRHPVTCARRKLTVLRNPIRSLCAYGCAVERGVKKGKEARFVRDHIRCGKRRNERAPYRSRRAPNDRSEGNRDSWLPRGCARSGPTPTHTHTHTHTHTQAHRIHISFFCSLFPSEASQPGRYRALDSTSSLDPNFFHLCHACHETWRVLPCAFCSVGSYPR